MRDMGKAMMGTGEATGEKRALTAAEAAISNPLIDDNSMKGAKGLLISITGGRDLTLYEVDEAATRIREEVDQDANIIVGATFDESLDGIIRVSVVATGIDQGTRAAQPSPKGMEARLSELTQQLRINTQRLERAETPMSAAAPTAQARGAEPQPAAIDDVTIQPMPPKPSLFPEPAAERPGAQEATPDKGFIPPPPQRPVRTPRMPRIEDLPLPAQAELRARRERAEGTAERRPSLLQRIASVGLGRRGDAEPATRPAPVAETTQGPTNRPQESRGGDARAQDLVSEYAKRSTAPRPAPQGLDMHGRPLPLAPSVEDDQLEIPAFLRRQAN
jgi:cell division protein FtsZ